MRNYFILIAVLVLLASCRPTRNIGKAVSKKDSAATAAVVVNNGVDTQQLIRTTLQNIANNHINYTTFTAKVAIDYKGTDGKSNGFNANIRMYKDSAIWLSANAVLGIEAMRALITKDSVKLLNKLDKVYTARSISYLREVTSLPLDLSTLQEIIIGNPVYLDSNVIRYSSGNGFITMLSLGEHFRNMLTLNESNNTLVHSKLDDADPRFARTASLWYSDYDDKEGLQFATKRQIVVSERGRLEIKLDFKNINFNESISFPFSIPKNYRRD